MYQKAGVSGPTEFGKLPVGDRLFWSDWLDEHVRRAKERDDELDGSF